MKVRVYLSVGALLLFLAPLGCSDKAESPAPETPPEEQPTPEPEPEKPEFVDANMSMEELMKTEDPDRNYRLVSYRDDTCAMYSFFDYDRIATRYAARPIAVGIRKGGRKQRLLDLSYHQRRPRRSRASDTRTLGRKRRRGRITGLRSGKRMFSSKCRCETDRIRRSLIRGLRLRL